mgnify:CR=1 FL=1
MDIVREQLNKPYVIGVICLLIGLVLGWFVIGWWLWPVKWTDAAPQHLRQDIKEQYLRMTIDSYAQNKDASLAKSRFESLGEAAPQLLQSIEANPQLQNPVAIAEFRAAVQAPPVGIAIEVTPGLPTPAPTEKTFASTLKRVIFPLLCVVILLVVGAFVALYFIRGRRGFEREYAPDLQEGQVVGKSEWEGYETLEQAPPMVQFMASYKLGDDLFDDSFSIDSLAGEFLGECGVGTVSYTHLTLPTKRIV